MSFFFLDGENVASIAFVTSANANGPTIVCPTIQGGDVAVLFDWALNSVSSPPALVIPSGFTQLSNTLSASNFFRGVASYKVLLGTESGATLTGMAGDSASNASKVLLIFRPDVPASPTTSTWLASIVTSSAQSQAIAASGQPAPLIRLAAIAFNGTAVAPTFSGGTFDAQIVATSGDLRIRAGYAIQNTAPADDTVQKASTGTSWMTSGWLRLS